MISAVYLVFGVSVTYATVANAVVFIALRRRHVPFRFVWSGTPGYLYRKCVEAGPMVGTGLRRVALTANIALLLAFLCLPAYMSERR